MSATIDGKQWNGQTEVPYGATVVLTATPTEGWEFLNWITDDLTLADNTANPLTFTMPNKAVTVTAKYNNASLSDAELVLSETTKNMKVLDQSSVTFTTSSDGEISVVSSDSQNLKVSLEANNNTINIIAYAAGVYTVTVTQAETAEYKEDTATLTVNVTKKATTVTIDDELVGELDIYKNDDENMLVATVNDSEDGGEVSNATITWTSSNEAVATVDGGVLTLKSAGTTTITASYAGNDEYEGSSATYELTVTDTTPYVQPTTVEVAFNNTFFGCEAFTSWPKDKETSYSGTKDGVIVVYDKGSSSNMYISAAAIRLYDNNSLTITAPDNYNITKIVLAGESGFSSNLSAQGLSSGTWTGDAHSVVISGNTNKNNMTGATITLAPVVSITSAGLATYVSNYTLDYSNVDGLAAYKAKVSANGITFNRVTTVPAGEGVLLRSLETLSETKKFTVPVVVLGDNDNPIVWGEDENDFVRGTGVQVASQSTDETGATVNNYILNSGSQGVGFYKANNQVVATNRAYLSVSAANAPAGNNARLAYRFVDDVVTAISTVSTENSDNAVYNMQGQRVAKPAKGLYVVGGKKVVVK